MSSNDKTRQKLVDSMRKTKVGATKKAVPKEKIEAGPVTKPAPVAKKAPAKKVQPKAAAKVSNQKAADPYQSRQRVWPD